MWARLATACVLLAGFCAGCTARITPPAHLTNPVSVYVADYGRHSSIILPTGGPNLIEYTYGDWQLYAQNRYRWYIGFTKLLLTEQGAMGRRTIEFVANEQDLRKRVWAKRLIKIEVEHDLAASLLSELETMYNSRIETQIYNAPVTTYFVQHDSRYWLMNNCNHATAEYLRRLGCDVRGCTVLSGFKVRPPGRTIEPEP